MAIGDKVFIADKTTQDIINTKVTTNNTIATQILNKSSVKSIQRGTVTVQANTSATVNIVSLNTSKSVVFFDVPNGVAPINAFPSLTATTLTFPAHTVVYSATWQIIEYN